MAGGAKTVIDIIAQLTDKTANGVRSAEGNMSKLEKSVDSLQKKLGNAGKSKLEVKASLKDNASKGLTSIWNIGKKIAGKVWTATVKLADLASAPLKKIWDMAKNPITQMVAFTGVSVGAADTLNTYKDFEQGMANVKAISGASDTEFEALTEKAKELGETTQFSASQAAAAMENLAMAGWKSNSIIEGMPGLLSLAAAGSVDLATASDVVASAVAQFGYEASESSRIADVLAATATSSKTDVQGLGESLKYAGPLAGSLGYSIEDVALALGLMGNNAIDASTAGTTLRSLFTRMGKQGELTAEESNEVANAMKRVGVSMVDSSGKSKSLMTVMKELRTGFSKLSQSEKTQVATSLAGQEAMSGLLAIVNASDEDFNALADSINHAEGAAQNMANVKMDTLQGSIYYLQSAVEGLQISVGEKVSPYFKGIIDAVTAAMPGIQSTVEGALDWLDTKVQSYRNIISAMTSSEEWKSADLNGKINIAWGKLIGEPFTKWWNGSGKRTIAGAIGSIFSEAGKILPGGEKAGLASWMSLGAIVKVADPVVKGVGSMIDALNSINPVAGTVGTAASVIGTALAAIGTAIEVYNQKQLSNNLEDHFGDISLSASDAAAIAEQILTAPWKVDVDLALGELKNADKVHDDAELQLQTMEELTWQTSLGVVLDESGKAEFMTAAETYAADMKEELESRTFSAYLNTAVFLGDTKEGEDLSGKIIDWATEDIGEMEDLSRQISEKVGKAIEDGIIDADEQAAISAIQEKMSNIMGRWYDSQADAQMDLIKQKYGNMGVEELKESGYRELMSALNERNMTQEASLDEDYTSYMAQLHSMRTAGRITEEEFGSYQEIANRNYLNQRASNRGKSMQVGVDTLRNAYSEKLSSNSEKMDAAVEEAMEVVQGRIEQGQVGLIDDAIGEIMNMGNGKKGKVTIDEDQAGLHSLLDTLTPDATVMQGLMDQYAESGQAVPQAFMDSYYDAMELMASAGDSDASLQTFAHRLAESGNQSLIDAMNELDAEGELSEAVSAAWKRANLAASDEELEIDSQAFQLKGDPEIKNKDEWADKLHQIEQNLEETEIGTINKELETEADITVEVKKGDTLSAIGEAVGVSWQELAEYNDLKNPDFILPGATIKVPKESVNFDTSGVTEAMNEAISQLSESGATFGEGITAEGLTVTLGDVDVDPAQALEQIAAAVGTSVDALNAAGITEATITTGASVTIPPELINVDTSELASAIETAAQSSGGGSVDVGGVEANADANVNVDATGVETSEARTTAEEETQNAFESEIPVDGDANITLTQTNNASAIYSETASQVRSTYSAPISASATVNVSLNWHLLNPSRSISVSGAGSGSGSLYAAFNAEGDYIDSPMLSVIGEDGPEYIVPVSEKHRERGLKLWQQAGHDLGIPGFADGGMVGWGMPASAGENQTGNTDMILEEYEPEVPEPIFSMEEGSSGTTEAGSPTVNIENLQFDVNIDGAESQDPQALADAIRENIRGMQDDIAYMLAASLKQVYTNTPKTARRA